MSPPPPGVTRTGNGPVSHWYESIMESNAIAILDKFRVLAISTVRPDGWPQATMVSFANDGLLIYFIISRTSQKFANIQKDDRISMVVGCDCDDPKEIKALSIAAQASEVRDPGQREHAIDLVLQRHPALARLPRPEPSKSAVMRAFCRIITIIDYSKGFGHTDVISIGPSETVWMNPARSDDWGFNPSPHE